MLAHQLSHVGTSFTIQVGLGDAVDARRSIVLEYEVFGAAAAEEFEWIVNGPDWGTALEDVSVEVILPKTAQGASLESSRSPRELISEQHVERSFGWLAATETLALHVKWLPTQPARALETLPAVKHRISVPLWLLTFSSPRNDWLLVFPVGALLLGYTLLRVFGARRPPRTIALQEQPPDQIRPAEFGVLVGGSTYGRIVAGTLADLGRRGLVSVDEVSIGTQRRRKCFLISRLDRESRDAQLAKYERALIPARGMAWRSSAPHASDVIPTTPFFALVRDRGYYARNSNDVRWYWLGCAVCAGLPFLNVLLLEKSDVLPTVVAIVLATAILASFVWRIMPRTQDGDRAFMEALGFAKFLRQGPFARCEHSGQAFRAFERYLPYALVLGLEEQLYQSFRVTWGALPALTWYKNDAGEPVTPPAIALTALSKSIAGYDWNSFLLQLLGSYVSSGGES